MQKIKKKMKSEKRYDDEWSMSGYDDNLISLIKVTLESSIELNKEIQINEVERVIGWCIKQIENPYHMFEIAEKLITRGEYERGYQIINELLINLKNYYILKESQLQKITRIEELTKKQEITIKNQWKLLDAEEKNELNSLIKEEEENKITKSYLQAASFTNSIDQLNNLYYRFIELYLTSLFREIQKATSDIERFRPHKDKAHEIDALEKLKIKKKKIINDDIIDKVITPHHINGIIDILLRSNYTTDIIIKFGNKFQSVCFLLSPFSFLLFTLPFPFSPFRFLLYPLFFIILFGSSSSCGHIPFPSPMPYPISIFSTPPPLYLFCLAYIYTLFLHRSSMLKLFITSFISSKHCSLSPSLFQECVKPIIFPFFSPFLSSALFSFEVKSN